MTEQGTRAGSSKSMGRSPNYPSMSLEKAVERLARLYEREGRHKANIATVANSLGFKSTTSGPATTTYAALKAFALIDEDGSGKDRRAWVSDLGYRILRAPEAQRIAAIKDAALRPASHREMTKRFPEGLPSEENLLWQLEEDLGFTPSGAQDFVRKYRATIAYAGLDTSPSLLGEASDPEESEAAHEDQGDDGDEEPGGQQRHLVRRHNVSDAQTITVPMIGGSSVIVEGQFPVSEEAWQHFIKVLDAMKPGLVTASEPAFDSGPQEDGSPAPRPRP